MQERSVCHSLLPDTCQTQRDTGGVTATYRSTPSATVYCPTPVRHRGTQGELLPHTGALRLPQFTARHLSDTEGHRGSYCHIQEHSVCHSLLPDTCQTQGDTGGVTATYRSTPSATVYCPTPVRHRGTQGELLPHTGALRLPQFTARHLSDTGGHRGSYCHIQEHSVCHSLLPDTCQTQGELLPHTGALHLPQFTARHLSDTGGVTATYRSAPSATVYCPTPVRHRGSYCHIQEHSVCHSLLPDTCQPQREMELPITQFGIVGPGAPAG